MEKVKGMQELYKLHREFNLGSIFVGDQIENPDLINMIQSNDDIMINDGIIDNPNDELRMKAGYDDDYQYTDDNENGDDTYN